MKKSMTISYEIENKLYLNLTNKCPCACTFCIRNNSDNAYGSDPLWLEHEPSMEEIFENLDKRDIPSYEEIIFCGFGEPTERLDAVEKTAEYLRKKGCKKLRINTNGLGERINGSSGSTAEKLCEIMDTVSISLNAGTKDEYMKVTRPKYENAFSIMRQFIVDCVNTHKAEVIVSVVDVIPQNEIDEARKIAEECGAKFRIRAFS